MHHILGSIAESSQSPVLGIKRPMRNVKLFITMLLLSFGAFAGDPEAGSSKVALCVAVMAKTAIA